MLRTGIIGMGYWGQKVFRAFLGNPRFSVIRIADHDPVGMQNIRREFAPDIRVSLSPEALLDSDDLDVVVICTPPDSHFEFCRTALGTGRHVWVEKPFCTTLDQARELIELSRSKNRILFPDFTYLFNACFKDIKALVKHSSPPFCIDSKRHNRHHSGKGGSVISDLAVHDFSILYYLFPQLFTDFTAENVGLDDYAPGRARINIDLPLLKARIEVSWNGDKKCRDFVVSGKNGRFKYCLHPVGRNECVMINLKNHIEVITHDRGGDALSAACESFYEQISTQTADEILLNAAMLSHFCQAALEASPVVAPCPGVFR